MQWARRKRWNALHTKEVGKKESKGAHHFLRPHTTGDDGRRESEGKREG